MGWVDNNVLIMMLTENFANNDDTATKRDKSTTKRRRTKYCWRRLWAGIPWAVFIARSHADSVYGSKSRGRCLWLEKNPLINFPVHQLYIITLLNRNLTEGSHNNTAHARNKTHHSNAAPTSSTAHHNNTAHRQQRNSPQQSWASL